MNAHVPRREVRFELPDPDAPGFREEIARQVALINAAADHDETMAWIGAHWVEMEREISEAERAAEAAARER